jgi:hypothetical protein
LHLPGFFALALEGNQFIEARRTIMKRNITAALALVFSLTAAGSAWADRDEHRGGFRDGDRWEHHDRDGGHRERGNDWALPLGLLLFADVLAQPPRPALAPPVVYEPAYYPQPAPVYAPPPAPVYIAPPAPVVSNYWYYCPSAGNYYPYVARCPGGWQQVVPQPQ